mgnify:CR=1 FL=1
MEEVKTKLLNYVNPETKKQISKSSAEKVYLIKYKILRKNLDPDAENPEFLLDFDKTMKFVNEKYQNIQTRKSVFTSILAVLNSHGLDSKKYKDEQTKLLIDIEKNVDKHKKTEKQNENWTTLANLRSVIPYYEKLINDPKLESQEQQYELLKKWIVAFLYVGDDDNPPFRLNYSVDIIEKKDYDYDSTNNYLVLNKGVPEIFSWGEHKNSNKKGTLRVRIGKKLKEALKTWLQHNKSSKYLLLNDIGGKMSSTSLGIFISKVFEPTGKHITLNLIRHIYITSTFDVDYETSRKKTKIARAMGHNVATQENYHLT